MTNLQRFDPFRQMRDFNPVVHHPLWPAYRWGGPVRDVVNHTNEAWRIPMDVRRSENALTVSASLPGFAADDVDVSISPDRILSVKASRPAAVVQEGDEYLMRERRVGSFARAIRLPGDLNLDDAAVILENGELTVNVPMAEAAQTRRLPITAPVSDA